jgi:ERCC4-type nuclease
LPIYTDTRGEGEKAIAEILRGMQIPVELRHIDSGDYVFNEIAIERKTISDLICSVISKENRHFWNQIKTMKETYKKPIVLIEGEFDWENRLQTGIYYALIGGWGIPVIFTENHKDSAKKISKLFDKYGEGSQSRIPPPVVHKETSTKYIKWAMVQCVDGIGGTLAKKILDAEPLIISTALNYTYISNRLKTLKIPETPRKRLLKVLFNED